MRSRALLATSAVALSAAVAGCGSQQDGSPAAKTTDASSAMSMSMPGMATLAQSTSGDMQVGLEAMAPETFFVSEGARLRRQSPAPDAKQHMMVTLTDRQSGIRLPDATVTLRLATAAGRTVYDGPLYPMIGRGMGMHYGENVPLPTSGSYTAQLVVGPPRIGRHMDSQGAWTTPVRLEQRFTWDGRSARPAS